jgi:hypothetical protein
VLGGVAFVVLAHFTLEQLPGHAQVLFRRIVLADLEEGDSELPLEGYPGRRVLHFYLQALQV